MKKIVVTDHAINRAIERMGFKNKDLAKHMLEKAVSVMSWIISYEGSGSYPLLDTGYYIGVESYDDRIVVKTVFLKEPPGAKNDSGN